MLRQMLQRRREIRVLRKRIAEETAFHIEQAVQCNRQAGMSPRSALGEARLRFGDRREIARHCKSIAMGPPSPTTGDWPLSFSPAAAALVAVLAPVALTLGLLPYHLQPLPGVDSQGLAVSEGRVPHAFGSAQNGPEDLAAFRRAAGVVSPPTGRGSIASGLTVSANFFSLQQVQAAMGPGFSSAPRREIALSDRLWRTTFAADPNAIGGVAEFNGERYSIVAVVPDGYWFLSPAHEFWIRTPKPALHGTAASILVHLDQDLVRTVERLDQVSLFSLSRNHLISLREASQVRVRAAAWIVGCSALMLMLLGLVQMWTLAVGMDASQRAPRMLGRNYLFLLAKALPALASLAVLWVAASELGPAAAGTFGGVWTLFSTFLFALLSLAIVWQSLVDQRLRCCVCLRRLAMPLPLGVIGSVLFELPGTEYICRHGHGTLYVPAPTSESLQLQRWREPEPAWRELLGSAR